eukprot:TRINITY_DN11756_c0_g1_i1.p1 TRINITY_DN11756_c0_g1~~TRINITY_DN11756_c0_g1_i1.p1  ORF type:complete len:388 (-),score=86.27 TRINITY_DN11756_c0_g1_i1:388-1551(-)
METAEKYKSKVKDLLPEPTGKLQILKSKESALLDEVKREMIKYSRYHSKGLKRSYRKLAQVQAVRLQAQQQLEATKIVIVNKKQQEMSNIIFKVNANVPIVDIYQESFVPVKSLFQNPQLVRQNALIKRLQFDERKCFDHLAKIRDKEKIVKDDVRQKKLHLILETLHVDLTQELGRPLLIEYNDAVQDDFDQFICDQRYREGKQIYGLQNALHEQQSIYNIQPEDITDFLAQFCNTLMTKFQLPQLYEISLNVLLSRTVFPMIGDFCSMFLDSKTTLELQDKLSSSIKALRKLPPERLFADICVRQTFCGVLTFKAALSRSHSQHNVGFRSRNIAKFSFRNDSERHDSERPHRLCSRLQSGQKRHGKRSRSRRAISPFCDVRDTRR